MSLICLSVLLVYLSAAASAMPPVLPSVSPPRSPPPLLLPVRASSVDKEEAGILRVNPFSLFSSFLCTSNHMDMCSSSLMLVVMLLLSHTGF